jgi:hypothetical protein
LAGRAIRADAILPAILAAILVAVTDTATISLTEGITGKGTGDGNGVDDINRSSEKQEHRHEQEFVDHLSSAWFLTLSLKTGVFHLLIF